MFVFLLVCWCWSLSLSLSLSMCVGEESSLAWVLSDELVWDFAPFSCWICFV